MIKQVWPKKIPKEKPRPKKEKTLRIILPFRLPTWNQLLAMNQWQRKEVRDWIKDAVFMCIVEQTGSPMQMGEVRKLQLTDYAKQEYLRMITPNSSRKLRTAKRLSKVMKKQ